VLSTEATNTNFIVFGSNSQLTALEATMHANYYTADGVCNLKYDMQIQIWIITITHVQ